MKTLDWLLVAAVIVGIFFAVRHMRKNGGSCGCSHNCSSCEKKCRK
ncbi:hypothetical protein IMSAG049_01447 [Clostridiales bacterium]|nr:hypothetical protein IMSAG049_01447 [Clostridiales bacterium]